MSLPEEPIDTEHLPSPIALAIAGYYTEERPELRLWQACNAVEMTLRLLTFVGIAELRERRAMTPEVIRYLALRIEEPTLGKWREMAETVITEQDALSDQMLPAASLFFRDIVSPLLLGENGKEKKSERTSLIYLRNYLAHSGGVTGPLASKLLNQWESRFTTFAHGLSWMTQIKLIVRSQEGAVKALRGPNAISRDFRAEGNVSPSLSFSDTSRGLGEVFIVCGDRMLTLWPFAVFGIPRAADSVLPATEEALQVYTRCGEVQLQFTSIGSESVAISESDKAGYDAFLDLFSSQVLVPKGTRGEQFTVRSFDPEIRREAERLVGRERELEMVLGVARDGRGGVLWLTGPAGIGKSCLLARTATELLDTHPLHTRVLPYRFRVGDDRCSRETFCRFAVERLAAFGVKTKEEEAKEKKKQARRGSASADEEIVEERRPPFEILREQLANLGKRRVIFILDGLDEIAEVDRRFAAEVPLSLAGPNLTWLCAGRPEYGLQEVFAEGKKCRHLFPPDGLPTLREDGVRAMILEKIGHLRRKLLMQDRDEGGAVINPFIVNVAKCARGLPIYVTYVIGDILNGRIRALDANERLPPSLDAYYEELFRRHAVGIINQILTPLLATLAVALEPLSESCLAEIMVKRTLLAEDDEPRLRVSQALSAAATMLRRTLTPDGELGYTLFHHSLRDHMASNPEVRGALVTARRALGSLASTSVGTGSAGRYLHRRGVAHLLECGEKEEAAAQLSDFSRVISRLEAIGDPEGVEGMNEDWQRLRDERVVLSPDQEVWESFWAERVHVLRRGKQHWLSCRILLQLAVEHADNSPVTRQAESWLEMGKCNWVWLRDVRRPAKIASTPWLRVFACPKDSISGGIELQNGRVLSWSSDGVLRVWDAASAGCRSVLKGHTTDVSGAIQIADGRILSWANDGSIRVWNPVLLPV